VPEDSEAGLNVLPKMLKKNILPVVGRGEGVVCSEEGARPTSMHKNRGEDEKPTPPFKGTKINGEQVRARGNLAKTSYQKREKSHLAEY